MFKPLNLMLYYIRTSIQCDRGGYIEFRLQNNFLQNSKFTISQLKNLKFTIFQLKNLKFKIRDHQNALPCKHLVWPTFMQFAFANKDRSSLSFCFSFLAGNPRKVYELKYLKGRRKMMCKDRKSVRDNLFRIVRCWLVTDFEK